LAQHQQTQPNNDDSNLNQRRSSVPQAVINSPDPPPPHHSPFHSLRSYVITPASSPVLKQMLPREPVSSAKPWNCLSQKSIDECISLIEAVEGHWSPGTHKLFSPKDRMAVLELLRVGKRLEQQGTGLFLELWPHVLSFCGRGWFENHLTNMDANEMMLSSSSQDTASTSLIPLPSMQQHHAVHTNKVGISNLIESRNDSADERIEETVFSLESHGDDGEYTQFQLDGDEHF